LKTVMAPFRAVTAVTTLPALISCEGARISPLNPLPPSAPDSQEEPTAETNSAETLRQLVVCACKTMWVLAVFSLVITKIIFRDKMLTTRFKFPQRQSSGMFRALFSWKETDVSEVLTSSLAHWVGSSWWWQKAVTIKLITIYTTWNTDVGRSYFKTEHRQVVCECAVDSAGRTGPDVWILWPRR
jgi:hypothetical protein